MHFSQVVIFQVRSTEKNRRLWTAAVTSWLTEESDRAALSAVFHVRWCWSTEHSPATVILPVWMGYDECFIICNTHYLKHSGRNTGTLRWITMNKRSILQRASGLRWCIKIFSQQVQHRFTRYFQHSVLRWEAKLLSSFHFLVKNIPCWLWLAVWKNFQTSVCAVFQNFDISNPEGQHRSDLILPLFSLK